MLMRIISHSNVSSGVNIKVKNILLTLLMERFGSSFNLLTVTIPQCSQKLYVHVELLFFPTDQAQG